MTGQDATAPVVRLQGIHKWFDDNHVLRGVDLSVSRGEHVVVFGPSGSGKSTLLRTVNLLEEPQKGSVTILGVEYGPGLDGELGSRQRGDARQLRQHVGMVFQQFNLFPHMTVLDNVAIALRRVRGVDRSEAEERAARQLRRVGLLQKISAFPAQLSGGQQQRVAIARALVTEPALLLADEPTGNLDTTTGEEIMALLERIQAERTMALVVITHEPEIAGRAKRRIELRDGLIVADAAATAAP